MYREPPKPTTRERVFHVLGGFFIANAVLAELIGGKLFQVATPWHTFTLSCGVVLWPVVFVMTDVINEHFGRAGVRMLTLIATAVIAWSFFALGLAQWTVAAPFSPVDDVSFARVFTQSRWIIVGSLSAFLVAQLIDANVFHQLKSRLGGDLLSLRATGSTLVSQFLDTFLVGFIGLYLPSVLGQIKSGEPFTFSEYLNTSMSGYVFKFVVAIAVTPALYLLHAIVNRHLNSSATEGVDGTDRNGTVGPASESKRDRSH